MLIESLKKLNHSSPDFVKAIFWRQLRKRLVNNHHFLAQLSEINRVAKLSREGLNEYHTRKLVETLSWANQTVPFYRDLFRQLKFTPSSIKHPDDLQRIPTLSRSTLEGRFQDIISKGVPHGSFYQGTTGGTTGSPIKLVLDNTSIYRERAFIYSIWSRLDYDWKKSRLANFRGVQFGSKPYKLYPVYNELLVSPFDLSASTVRAYNNRIEKFQAQFLGGYPSSLINYAQLQKHSKLQAPVKGILLISEECDDGEREIIEDAFGCRTLSFFGHSERAAIAGEVYQRNIFQFEPAYGYTEIIDGEIVCTGYLNRSMPLIRYHTGDHVGEVVPADEHKSGKLTVHRIFGRWDKDYLIGKNDERIYAAAVNFHDRAMERIRRYQLYQSVPGQAIFRYEIDNPLTPSEQRLIQRTLDAKVKRVLDLEMQQVEKIPLTPRGKLRKIIRETDGLNVNVVTEAEL